MKKQLLLSTALLASAVFAQTAFAQTMPTQAPAQVPLATTTSQAQGGVFPLPDGVERLVGLDAQNVAVAQMRPEVGQDRQYRLIRPKHVYVGGIVALFGGTIVPTTPFVSPGLAQGNQFGAAPQGNFGFPGGGINQTQQNNGFFFPQGNFNTGQQGNFNLNPNRNAPLRPNNQPGLSLGTPFGNVFLPAQTEIQ